MFNPKMESMPRDEMVLLQSLRLKQMIKRIYKKVPAYRQKFDEAGLLPGDIRGVEDLSKLPFTYKQDLRDNYPYGLFAAPMEEIIRIHASSGTTGKQTVVGYTKNDIDLWAEVMARTLAGAGATRKDIVHVSFGYGLFTGGFGAHYGAEKLGAAVVPVSVGNTRRQIQIMKDFGATLLCCTPSYALYIAETIAELGYTPADFKLRSACFGAEPWTENMRREIEDKLKIKAYDIYGMSELIGPGVSFECECQSGMHINEDHFIPEIIDPDTGKVLPDGTAGELVFTCVTKEALPLVRYRTRDIASLTRETCGCGRTLVKMSKPSGRTDDMLIIRGVNVFPSQVETVLLELAETAPHYMLIVDRIDNLDTLEVVVEMKPDSNFDSVGDIERLTRRIRAAIESMLGIAAKVRLAEPKSIQRSEGKAVRVMDNRKSKTDG